MREHSNTLIKRSATDNIISGGSRRQIASQSFVSRAVGMQGVSTQFSSHGVSRDVQVQEVSSGTSNAQMLTTAYPEDLPTRKAQDFATLALRLASPIVEAVPIVGTPIKAAIGAVLELLSGLNVCTCNVPFQRPSS